MFQGLRLDPQVPNVKASKELGTWIMLPADVGQHASKERINASGESRKSREDILDQHHYWH